MKFLALFKHYWAVAAGAVIGVLTIVAQGLYYKNKELKRENKQDKADARHSRNVVVADTTINEQEDIRLKQAKDEISADHTSTELEAPNEDW